MRERALTAGLLGVFLAWEWSAVERPSMPLAAALLIAAAAVVPAVVFAAGRRLLGAGLAIAGAVVAVAVATGFYPWERNHPFYLARVAGEIDDGIRSWMGTTTPIDVGRFPDASADVRLALFALVAGIAWLLVVGRRPVATVPRGAYLGAGQLEDEPAQRPARIRRGERAVEVAGAGS
ncbi:MAG TPA: hypothetical protein VM823_03630, partial [Gaiellales bacterium]|nr:hypothetical protein [Gaiellales bacterium]